MKTLLIFLSLVLSLYTSYAQSIEVIWEKKLTSGEKFLAISPDGSYLLLQGKNTNGLNSIYVCSTTVDNVNDTLPIETIVSADISMSGKFIIAASNRKTWYYISLSPFSVIQSGTISFEPSEEHKYTIVKFSDTSDSKGFLFTGSKVGNFGGYSTSGIAIYYDWVSGAKLREVGSDVPLSMSVLPFDSGTISLLNHSFSIDFPGQRGSSGSTNFTTIWKIENGTKSYKRLNDLTNAPHLCDSGRYILYTNSIFDLSNLKPAKQFQNTLKEKYIVLGKSRNVVEFTGEKDKPFTYRNITRIEEKYPISTDFYDCSMMIPNHKPNSFLTFSKDGRLRLYIIDLSDSVKYEKPTVDFQPHSKTIRPNDKIQFQNISFPLSSVHKYEWDFGDGSTSTERDPIHQYMNSGTYSVRLIVKAANELSDTITKIDAINVVFIDTNIMKSKKIWNKKLFSIEYSPNGEELVCRDTMNSFVIDKSTLYTLDSNINDIHGLHIIGNRASQYYLTINKGSKYVGDKSCSISSDIKIAFNIRLRRYPGTTPIDSFQIVTINCDLPFGKIYERMRTVMVNDSVLGFSYSVKNSINVGHPPSPQYFNQGIVKFFSLNNSNQEIPFKGEIFDGLYPGKTQFIPPHYILSEKGITETIGKKLIHKYSFQNINDFAILDENLFLAVTNDFATPVILFNIKGDTLHLFRSSLGVQTCVAVNPINKGEFATADNEGRVTIWKIPESSSTSVKPLYIDFTANIRDNTTDTITFKNYIFPPSKDLKVEWDFGDGEISTEVNPKHFYKNTGLYTVKLRYYIPQLLDTIIVKENYIHIRKYPKSIEFSVSDTSVNKYFRIYINNLTDQLQHFRYIWDFGDGTTSSEIHPEHFYAEYGTYTISLTVIRPGMNDTTIKKINIVTVKPIFKITWIQSPQSVKIGHPVTYEVDIEPKDIKSSIVWDFGNFHKEYTPKVTYTFPITDITTNSLGKKRIQLTVRMDTTKYQESKNLLIGPDIQIRPKHSEISLKGKWTSYPSIAPQKGDYSFEWNWGDGTSSVAGLDAKHGYKKAGVYRIILRASERISGTFAEDTVTVVVLPEVGKFSAYPNISQGEPINLHWYGSNGTISIQSLTGETVRLFQYSGETASHHLQWNLDDHYQNRLPPGLYYCTLKDSYGLPLSNPVFILY